MIQPWMKQQNQEWFNSDLSVAPVAGVFEGTDTIRLQSACDWKDQDLYLAKFAGRCVYWYVFIPMMSMFNLKKNISNYNLKKKKRKRK